MKPHLYEGTLIACLKCFKKPSDPIHIQEFLAPSPVEIHNNRKQPNQTPVLYNPRNEAIPPTCKGHACPKCKDEWNHNYNCGSINNGLCEKCAQQNAAEINRPKHIEEIKLAAEGGHLSGSEAVQLRLQHEEFVVLSIIKDSEGNDRKDWQERLADHIKTKETIIERLRIELASCTRVKARQEMKDLTKLSPEEQEQYRRDTLKPKRKAKEPSEVASPASGNKKEKNIVGLLKLMGKADNAANRKLIEDMID